MFEVQTPTITKKKREIKGGEFDEISLASDSFYWELWFVYCLQGFEKPFYELDLDRKMKVLYVFVAL